MKQLMRRLALPLLALAATPALAHNPMCECTEHGEQITCKGGFSDGSGAPGVTLDVIGYDEQVLVASKLGDDSTLTFKRPEGEFYVLFDAGPGHVVEVDHADIGAP
ncbi:hypothetical protein HU735_04190 [Pseudomonas sp. BW16M2]|jgi:hypothetical protein|uniref:Secreted protein n=1 Tax=Pseudomonas peradeniyensis TaxID=2745488 RepID=A0A923G5Q1_9PSED|nr:MULTISPECIES: hypothetical protein [Pseudomonas]MBI6899460.1 hypothetical protein [Pseudomonas putida]KNX76963.1 hypothetical protein DA83_04455 [Pseudomonas sp. 250J]MBC3434601.1 hypothetical protein [Pseudomonas sp. BW16M2]MBV4507388.1 hypothetical protein [Pseudomonas peradeniyensis]MCU7241194.1 hypothetical protein [Pseudomonas peradeniyensis]